MTTEGRSSSSWLLWSLLIVVGLIIWADAAHTDDVQQQRPVKVTHRVTAPRTMEPTPGYGYSVTPGYGSGTSPTYGTDAPSYSPEPMPNYTYYGHPGYENPTPGDDGTADCSPGQPPVYVGSNDPNGLDGDGDGWGCE